MNESKYGSTGTDDNTRNGSKPPWAAVALLVIFAVSMLGGLLLLHSGATREPFFSDDYLFLDRARAVPLSVVLDRHQLAYGYWRPWSRGLHFWTLERAFGARPFPFHVASIALVVASLTLFFAYARRLAGMPIAFVSSYGVLALAAWDLPMRWPSAAQDLWAITLGLASLLAFANGRVVLACVALAPALLSKETAAVIPAIAFAHALVIDRRSLRDALLRVVPLVIVVGLWAVVHPALGAKFLHGAGEPARAFQSPTRALVRSVLAMLNLDALPRPVGGMRHALLESLFFAPMIGWLAWIVSRPRRGEEPRSPRRRIAVLGAAWAACAWLPLALPSLIWQPYYVLFGAMGFWLAAAALLPRGVLVALVTCVAVLRAPRLATHVDEWGDAVLHAQGRKFMQQTERFLHRSHPDLPPHARMFFGAVPRGMVFVLGPDDAPALRVWYRRPVSGRLWQDYRTRAEGEPSGPDYFFLHDSTSGWREVVSGAESADSARSANPTWAPDHERLAVTFTDAGAMRESAAEYAKLAAAFPLRADYAYLAGLSAETSGDAAEGARWYREAAQRPGADARMRERAMRVRP